MRKNSTTNTHLKTWENIFAEYKVTVKGREKLSIEETHQIQQVTLLLNTYESFKLNKEGGGFK